MTQQCFVLYWFLPPRRDQTEAHGKYRPGPQAALDGESAKMTIENVLDQRETKSGAAFGAALSDVDAIKTLGQARQMLGRNPGPIVAHGHDGVPPGRARRTRQGQIDPATRCP